LEEIARWSEDAGCEGILVFTDNAQLDTWLVPRSEPPRCLSGSRRQLERP
jgi:hypothetical protein